ncbi:cytochrome c3 family protein [Persephonella sp.]
MGKLKKILGMLKIFRSKKAILVIIIVGILITLPPLGYYAWQKRIPQKTALVLKNIVHNLFFEKHHIGDIYGVVHIEEMEEIELSQLKLPEEEKEEEEVKELEKELKELKEAEKVAKAPKPKPKKVMKPLPVEEFPKEFLPLKKVLHRPFKMGACAICHQVDEHGKVIKKGKKYPLTKGRVDELCYSCHKERYVKKYDHKPVKKGECLKCHDPHQSDTPKLLTAKTVPLLCVKCHGPQEAKKLKIKKVVDINVKYKHKPVDKNCLECHDPHTSDYKKLLITGLDWKMDFCLDCHSKVKDPKVRKKIDLTNWIKTVKVKHDAVYDKDECANCHNIHGSNNKGMLLKPQVQQCLTCHDKEVEKKETGEMLINMKKHLEENKYWHKPIKEVEKKGGCAACHNPHGSNNPYALKKFFTTEFYLEGMKLRDLICFECHKEKERFTMREVTSDKITKFRNGKENLHYVHTQGTKGRTCIACHDPHASKWPTMIGKYTNFNGILFPIRYKKTQTGGSCAPACHDEFKYDRLRPVKNIGEVKEGFR